jgi:DNA-directed RNA polymerase subunit RPC12/RpoP
MPIRFRCAYCNQLLGIARRKAGTVVRCPTCAGQVVVPAPEGGAEAEPSPASPKAALFERSDFDNLFEPLEPAPLAKEPTGAGAKSAQVSQPAGNPPAGGWRTEVGGEFDVEPVRAPKEEPPAPPAKTAGPRPGIVLSPMVATILSVLVILGLAAAFGAGLAVGYLWWGHGAG